MDQKKPPRVPRNARIRCDLWRSVGIARRLLRFVAIPQKSKPFSCVHASGWCWGIFRCGICTKPACPLLPSSSPTAKMHPNQFLTPNLPVPKIGQSGLLCRPHRTPTTRWHKLPNRLSAGFCALFLALRIAAVAPDRQGFIDGDIYQLVLEDFMVDPEGHSRKPDAIYARDSIGRLGGLQDCSGVLDIETGIRHCGQVES